jgi:hypothetical protein
MPVGLSVVCFRGKADIDQTQSMLLLTPAISPPNRFRWLAIIGIVVVIAGTALFVSGALVAH